MFNKNHNLDHVALLAESEKAPSLERAFLNTKQQLDSNGVAGVDIDRIKPLEFKTSGGTHGPTREHLLLAIEEDGIRDVVWYSPPAQSGDPDTEASTQPTLVIKPGLGEIVERGVGWQFHKELANRNPQSKIVTHATEGFGPSALRCSIFELPKHSLDNMAERGLWLMETYFPEDQIALVGISMGTNIFHRLLNKHRTSNSNNLAVKANVNYAPALVDPKNILRDMICSFPVAMTVDGFNEVLFRTSPFRMKEVFETLADSKPGVRDLLPMARQIIDLVKGIDEADVRANATAYETATIVGTFDPVGQVQSWRHMPVLLEEVHRRGHGIAIKPREGGIKVTNTLKIMGLTAPSPDSHDLAKKAA